MAKNEAPGQGQMPPGLAMLIGQLAQSRMPQGGYGGTNFGGLQSPPQMNPLAPSGPPPSAMGGGPPGFFGMQKPPMGMNPQPVDMQKRPMPFAPGTLAGPPLGNVPENNAMSSNPMAPDMAPQQNRKRPSFGGF